MYRSRTNAPLSSLTRHEAQRESKLRAQEESEKLEAMGQDSDLKAKKWVQEEFKNAEKKEKLLWEMDMSELAKLRRGKPKYYFRHLARVFMRFASEEAIPKKYVVNVSLTDKGILIKIANTRYQGAFAPSGLPSYDRHACKILAVKLGNTIAKLEGYIPSTEGGIYLPDKEHIKQYGRI